MFLNTHCSAGRTDPDVVTFLRKRKTEAVETTFWVSDPSKDNLKPQEANLYVIQHTRCSMRTKRMVKHTCCNSEYRYTTVLEHLVRHRKKHFKTPGTRGLACFVRKHCDVVHDLKHRQRQVALSGQRWKLSLIHI